MAAHKQALSFALAWFLLAGLFLTGEATNSRCKQKQVRERKPTLETLRWQEACLPLAVILGGCCGLVWWVLLIIYDISQKGGQKGLPQISGEVEMEEQKTTKTDYLEEWSEEGIKLYRKAASKENVSPLVELGSRPPSQPKEQGPTTFWAYLEQELERILLAIRRHRTTGQNPVTPPVVEVTPPPPQVPPSAVRLTPLDVQMTLPALQVIPSAVQVTPPAVQVTPPAVQVTPPAVEVTPPAVEKPSTAPGDWQSILDHIKKYAFTTERQSSPAVDKQQPLPGEGPSSQAVEKQSPSPEQSQSSPAQDQQPPPSEERQSSGPAKERKKSPRRPRSRSKRKSPSPPRSRGCNCPPRNRGRSSPCRNRGRRSPSRNRGCSSSRRRPCSKHK
ncbi:uncharacterized protein LOC143832705 isoform X2 [Paroedura picta]|uniref:uncharacterized protein LOC143832705 isoform X2 n=1 Tax=Paroedura picta TaxID=143630 RepID=UPI0040573C29